MSGVLVEASNNRLTLSATDGEISIRSQIEADVSSEGTALAPGRLLLEVLRSLSGDEVSIQRDGTQLAITSDKANFSLRSLPVEDFPKLPQAPTDTPLTLPADALADTIDRVARAASRDETRPVLTGILVSASESSLRMVATDSYRLSMKETQLESPIASDFESNVPARALQELSKVIGDTDAAQVSIASLDNQIVFGVERMMIASRVIDGQFPNHERLLPDSYEHEITISREEFLTVIRRISLMAQRNAPLRLKFEDGSVTAIAQTPDVGEASETVPVNFQGETLEIGFNPQFLQDGLESVDADELLLRLIHPHRPGLLEAVGADGEGRFLYLIMPVRLNV